MRLRAILFYFSYILYMEWKKRSFVNEILCEPSTWLKILTIGLLRTALQLRVSRENRAESWVYLSTRAGSKLGTEEGKVEVSVAAAAGPPGQPCSVKREENNGTRPRGYTRYTARRYCRYVDNVDMRGGEEIKENCRLSGQGKLPPYKESQKRTHQENR